MENRLLEFAFKELHYAEIVDEQNPQFLQSLASITDFHDEEFFPDWENADLILLGCPENRLSAKQLPTATSEVRKELYKMPAPSAAFQIADLGDFILPKNPEETPQKLAEILTILLAQNKKVLIIGGNQYLTYAQFLAYKKLQKSVHYVAIDKAPDFLTLKNALNEENFNAYILAEDQEDLLAHFALIGMQNHYVTKAEKDLFTGLFYEYVNLGKIKKNPLLIEPLLRDADFVSVDFSAVKASDAPATLNPTPAGFSVEEIAQLARYAGASSNLSSLGVYNFSKENLTVQSVATFLWYYIEGIIDNPQDTPDAERSNMKKIEVFLKDQPFQRIIFYEHPRTRRLWMEVPVQIENTVFLMLKPASYEDLQTARRNEIPKRWWMFYQKYQ